MGDEYIVLCPKRHHGEYGVAAALQEEAAALTLRHRRAFEEGGRRRERPAPKVPFEVLETAYQAASQIMMALLVPRVHPLVPTVTRVLLRLARVYRAAIHVGPQSGSGSTTRRHPPTQRRGCQLRQAGQVGAGGQLDRRSGRPSEAAAMHSAGLERTLSGEAPSGPRSRLAASRSPHEDGPVGLTRRTSQWRPVGLETFWHRDASCSSAAPSQVWRRLACSQA